MILAELRLLHEKATKGPWTHIRDSSTESHVSAPGLPGDDLYLFDVADAFYSGQDDGDLIVAMRNALPALLDVIEKAKKLIDEHDNGSSITQEGDPEFYSNLYALSDALDELETP